MIRTIIDIFNWKNNRNIKDKNKENVITVFIENNKRDITIKNDIKSLRTMIGIFNWKDDRNIIGKNIKKY